MAKHHRKNTGGLSKRDRGKRPGRRPVTSPREVSVERVDDYTLIVRVPGGVADDVVGGILLDVQLRTARNPMEASGVWLTPEEALEMEQSPDPEERGAYARPDEDTHLTP